MEISLKLQTNVFLMTLVMHCQMACRKNVSCTVFQYQKFTKICELKTHRGVNITDTNMIVGPDECGYMKGNDSFILMCIAVKSYLKYQFTNTI